MFFSWINFPEPLSIPWGSFRMFTKIREYIRNPLGTSAKWDLFLLSGINYRRRLRYRLLIYFNFIYLFLFIFISPVLLTPVNSLSPLSFEHKSKILETKWLQVPYRSQDRTFAYTVSKCTLFRWPTAAPWCRPTGPTITITTTTTTGGSTGSWAVSDPCGWSSGSKNPPWSWKQVRTFYPQVNIWSFRVNFKKNNGCPYTGNIFTFKISDTAHKNFTLKIKLIIQIRNILWQKFAYYLH